MIAELTRADREFIKNQFELLKATIVAENKQLKEINRGQCEQIAQLTGLVSSMAQLMAHQAGLDTTTIYPKYNNVEGPDMSGKTIGGSKE